MTAPCVLDGPIDRVSFHAYFEQFHVQTLRSGDNVVIDNLSPAAKPLAIRQAIKAAGAELRTAPYSLDFNRSSSFLPN